MADLETPMLKLSLGSLTKDLDLEASPPRPSSVVAGLETSATMKSFMLVESKGFGGPDDRKLEKKHPRIHQLT
jgi:hypothetical protein